MSLKLNSNSINYNVATVLDLTSIVNPSINDTVVVTEEGREEYSSIEQMVLLMVVLYLIVVVLVNGIDSMKVVLM